MCKTLLHAPDLRLRLTSPAHLAAAMRRWGYDVPRLPLPILTTRADLTKPVAARAPALWPAQGLPAWLHGLLNPKTHPLVQQLIAEPA